MPEIKWTRHGKQRLIERTLLSTFQLEYLLRRDLVVLIGQESGTQKIHKVFYSEPDKQCFIVVIDEATGAIITIEPPDFHHMWQIDPDVYRQAKALVMETKA